MEIRTKITDRKTLVDFLKQYTGQRANYLGAPGFQYVVGPYTVLRNANIQIDPSSVEPIFKSLQELGFVDTEEEDGLRVPINPSDVRMRMNLLNMISSRGKLISKAIGKEGALSINRSFLKQMQESNPEDVNAFDEAMALCKASTGLRGLKFYRDKVIFTCFQDDGTPVGDACVTLAKAMAHAAETKHWIKPEPEAAENEKYTFRVWLVSIGMKGKEYADARTILMYNLTGNATYRTEEQYQAAMAKLSKERKGNRKHADFTIL